MKCLLFLIITVGLAVSFPLEKKGETKHPAEVGTKEHSVFCQIDLTPTILFTVVIDKIDSNLIKNVFFFFNSTKKKTKPKTLVSRQTFCKQVLCFARRIQYLNTNTILCHSTVVVLRKNFGSQMKTPRITRQTSYVIQL